MRKRLLIIFSILLISTLIGACGITLSREYESGEVLVVDDFSDPNLQWDVWKRQDGSAIAYYEEGLVFIINSPNIDSVSTLNSTYDDVHLEVIADNLNGLMNNAFGLVCRYQDEKNYYAFLISSDGYYGILRILNGGYAVLNNGKLQYSEVIAQGQNVNHIRADCVGTQLTLTVNNTQLAQVEDEVFSDGLIGLTASSFDETGVAILFDNFLAIYP